MATVAIQTRGQKFLGKLMTLSSYEIEIIFIKTIYFPSKRDGKYVLFWMGVTEQPDYLLSTIYRFFGSFASNRPFWVHRRIWDLHENNSETTLALEINRSV